MSPSTVAIIVGPILAVDAAVSRAIHTAAKPFLPPFLLLLLEISADFRFSFPVSLSLLLSPPLRPFLIQFLLGLLFDLIFVGIVKLVFRRARPSYNHPSMSAAVPADHYSFPSGHASRVFFVAASVHFFSSAAVEATSMVDPSYSFLDGWVRDHRDGEVKGNVVVVVWIWATLTAISRILLGRHYVIDVAAGACLGILEALFALRFLRFEHIFVRFYHCSFYVTSIFVVVVSSFEKIKLRGKGTMACGMLGEPFCNRQKRKPLVKSPESYDSFNRWLLDLLKQAQLQLFLQHFLQETQWIRLREQDTSLDGKKV